MDNKEQVRVLLHAVNHMRDAYQALTAFAEAIDRQKDERLLQQWARRWERERRERRLQEARN